MSASDAGQVGTVYLLHFDPPYKRASHYCGWAKELQPRLDRHLAGNGSPLVRAAIQAGCRVELVRHWPGTTRAWERRLKERKNFSRECPVCREAGKNTSIRKKG